MLVDMNDALGGGLDDRQADFLQGIGRRAQILRDIGRDVVDALLPRGRDHLALAQRPADEDAFQRLARSLEPQLLLRGRTADPRRGPRYALAAPDLFARARPGHGALGAVPTAARNTLGPGVRTDRALPQRGL